jgi:hypothetical protein
VKREMPSLRIRRAPPGDQSKAKAARRDIGVACRGGDPDWPLSCADDGGQSQDHVSPGLITSSILYLPISLVIGWSCIQSRALSIAAFVGAALCGLALFSFVVWYGLFHFAFP